MSQFGVPESVLGHLYQHRYALLLLLRASRESSPDVELSLERADDIGLERDGKPVALVQTKHKGKRRSKDASLGDASPDLWKTLRVWSEALTAGSIKLPGVVLSLVSNGSASPGTAVSYLRPEQRDVSKALTALQTTMTTSKAQENEKAYEAFRKLSPTQRRRLLESVHVLDGSPAINDVQAKIEQELMYAVERRHVSLFFQRLEEWWHVRVISHLDGPDTDRIKGYELLKCIDDLRRQFHADNLPIDLCAIVTPPVETEEHRTFVRQLRLIALSNRSVELALRDYYRAFTHRSRWVRDDLLYIDELERYERKLVEAWEHAFEMMRDACKPQTPEDTKRTSGIELYRELTERRNIKLRPDCDEPFVMRGCFHLLADSMRVGWHIEFMDRLKKLLASPKREAS